MAKAVAAVRLEGQYPFSWSSCLRCEAPPLSSSPCHYRAIHNGRERTQPDPHGQSHDRMTCAVRRLTRWDPARSGFASRRSPVRIWRSPPPAMVAELMAQPTEQAVLPSFQNANLPSSAELLTLLCR